MGARLPALFPADMGSMRPIFINGRFTTQPLTGVQRYAGSIVAAMDERIGKEPGAWPDTYLVTPEGVADPGLANIRWIAFGGFRGHLWDQLSFGRVSRPGVAVGLANSVPLLHPRSLAVLYDAAVFRHPEFFSPRYARAHQILGRLIAGRARIATISDFSRRELADVLGIDPAGIEVAPCGTEHMTGRIDPTIVARLGLEDQPFFLTLGNRTRNKNLSLVVDALDLLGAGRAIVVAVGDVDAKVFSGAHAKNRSELMAVGRLSDEEVRGLMQRAQALVFPSFYEGFGIPPLEAMVHGCPVLASTADAVVETCGDAAAYFDPTEASVLARLMGEVLDGGADYRDRHRQRGLERARLFSWRESAQTLLAAARALARS